MIQKTEKQRYVKCYEKIGQRNINGTHAESERERRRRLKPILKFIGDTEHKKVVDIGCNQGFLLSLLKGYKVGVDIAVNVLKESKKKGLESICCNAENLCFKSECFDIIICTDILEHVLNPENVLKELYRILDKKGHLFIEIPYKEDLKQYDRYEGIYEFTHLRSFDIEYISKLLVDFTIIEKRGSIPKINHSNKYINFVLWKMYVWFPNLPWLKFYEPVYLMINCIK